MVGYGEETKGYNLFDTRDDFKEPYLFKSV